LIASFSIICRDITVGGKDSTEAVVKGEYKQVPKELISQLKTILEVLQNLNKSVEIFLDAVHNLY